MVFGSDLPQVQTQSFALRCQVLPRNQMLLQIIGHVLNELGLGRASLRIDCFMSGMGWVFIINHYWGHPKQKQNYQAPNIPGTPLLKIEFRGFPYGEVWGQFQIHYANAVVGFQNGLSDGID